MNLKDCHNFSDFRKLAKKKLPKPIFNYIDGAADDEVTYRRNTEAYERCDLVPNVLAGVDNIDMSTEIFGKKINMPLFVSPTALQRLFHHEGELAVAKAAEKFGTMFGISSLGTVSIERIANEIESPKLFQLYVHKDKGLTRSMIDRCKESNFDAMTLTVDTIVGGNRERDLYTGFTYPPKLTINSLISFLLHPSWSLNYLFRPKFELSQIKDYLADGTSISVNIGEYFTKWIDQSMDWKAAEEINKYWGKPFALKGIMSVEDAKKAIDIGSSAIIISNHGGRQLDGSRAPFDQLSEIVDAVGDKIDIICDGGIQRGTHVLKALSLGAKACSGGRLYLYALAAGGQKGVEKALYNLQSEIKRDMQLMGVTKISQLNKDNIRFR